MSLGMEVGLGPATVRLGTSSLRKRAQPPPNFWPMSIVAKTAGWIKMPLGTEVGLSPGDFVLDGDPASLCKKEVEPPMSIVAKRLYGSRWHLAWR